MAPNDPKTNQPQRHHFLFHIFRMDKAENPMPQSRAEALLQHLTQVFKDNIASNKRRR